MHLETGDFDGLRPVRVFIQPGLGTGRRNPRESRLQRGQENSALTKGPLEAPLRYYDVVFFPTRRFTCFVSYYFSLQLPAVVITSSLSLSLSRQCPFI